MLRLLLVEDHPLVREAMVGILGQLDHGVEILQAGTSHEALCILNQFQDIDLVLLDLALPGLDGFACMEILRKDHKSLPVVVISAYDDAHSIQRAFDLGASGFIPKTYPSDRILSIIRRVLEGEMFRPDAGLAAGISASQPASVDAISKHNGLTERQSQVLAQVVQGKSNREIAEALGISEGTVKIHITAVFKSIGVSSRTQALVAATNYTPPPPKQ